MCLLFRMRDWCCWPVVHWLVYCVDGKVVYKMFPSISFGCLCGMVLIALTFRLQFHSHVCYLIYAVHKQMLDYWFVYVIRVPCASQLWIFRIVRYTLCHRYGTLVCITLGLFRPFSWLIVGMLCLLLIKPFLDWIV